MSESKIITLSKPSDLEKLIKSEHPIFLDYSTSWCGPCKRLGVDLHKWIDEEKKYENVLIVKVMIDEPAMESFANEIESIPTLHFYNKGTRVTVPYKDGKESFNELVGYDKNKVEAALSWLNSSK